MIFFFFSRRAHSCLKSCWEGQQNEDKMLTNGWKPKSHFHFRRKRKGQNGKEVDLERFEVRR
jgi:hypothetical protein